jgi:hypothetical protein
VSYGKDFFQQKPQPATCTNMRSHFTINNPNTGHATSFTPGRMKSHFLTKGAAMVCALSGATAMMTGVCSAQIVASDHATDPTYAGGWSAGQNGGSGFGAWSFNGTDVVPGTLQEMSSASAIGMAWTLFNTNSSSGLANAGRSITGGLLPGQTLETVIQNPGANNFYRGFDILFTSGPDNNASGNNTAALRLSVFNYGTQFWNINDTGSTATPLSAPTTAVAGMRVDLTLTSATTYSLTMTPLNGAGAYSHNGTLAGPITWVDYREWDTASSGPSDGANNFGISYMTISVPEPSGLALIGLGVGGLLFLRRRT